MQQPDGARIGVRGEFDGTFGPQKRRVALNSSTPCGASNAWVFADAWDLSELDRVSPARMRRSADDTPGTIVVVEGTPILLAHAVIR